MGSKSSQEVVDDCNELARIFYKAHGYNVPAGYQFHQATHPHEQSMWNLAAIAYEHIEGTDPVDALRDLD